MIEVLNDPGTLGETPIGFLAVVSWGGGAAVAIMHDDERAKIKRIVYMLKPGENPLNAVYGKRTFEQKAITKAYRRRDERQADSDARWKADHRADFRREVSKVLRRSWSGEARETLASMLRWRP
jgi:hypothetical protein